MAIRNDFAPGEVLAAADLNDTFGSKLNIAGGKILQVLSATKTDTAALSTAATTFTSNISGLDVTITPSATSSKILLLAHITGGRSTDSGWVQMRFVKAGNAIGVGDAAGSRVRLTTGTQQGVTAGSDHGVIFATFLDSPNVATATTYGVQLYNTASGTATIYVNRSQSDTDSAAIIRGVSSLTVMEVSG
jgi:hypothetical protein